VSSEETNDLVVAQRIELEEALKAALSSQHQPGREAELDTLVSLLVADGIDIDRVRELESELFGEGAKPLALLTFDLPGIHDWVMDTARPAIMRGASLGLDDANKAVSAQLERRHLSPRAPIFSAGGQGTLIIGAHQIDEAKKAVTAAFHENLHEDATPTQAALEITCSELIQGPEQPPLRAIPRASL
jgi:hypothetical protein